MPRHLHVIVILVGQRQWNCDEMLIDRGVESLWIVVSVNHWVLKSCQPSCNHLFFCCHMPWLMECFSWSELALATRNNKGHCLMTHVSGGSCRQGFAFFLQGSSERLEKWKDVGMKLYLCGSRVVEEAVMWCREAATKTWIDESWWWQHCCNTIFWHFHWLPIPRRLLPKWLSCFDLLQPIQTMTLLFCFSYFLLIQDFQIDL